MDSVGTQALTAHKDGWSASVSGKGTLKTKSEPPGPGKERSQVQLGFKNKFQ